MLIADDVATAHDNRDAAPTANRSRLIMGTHLVSGETAPLARQSIWRTRQVFSVSRPRADSKIRRTTAFSAAFLSASRAYRQRRTGIDEAKATSKSNALGGSGVVVEAMPPLRRDWPK